MNNPPIEFIEKSIRKVQRRCYLNRFSQRCVLSTFVGLTIASLLFILNHWVWLPVWILATSLLTLSCLVSFFTLRPDTPINIAQQIDQRLGLKSRISSAWQYRLNTDTTAIAQRQDAVDKLIDPLVFFPYQLPKTIIFLFLPVSIILASFFFPYSYSRPTILEKLAIESAGNQLSQIANVSLQAEIDKTRKDISRGRVTTEQVEESLGKLQQQVQKQLQMETDNRSLSVENLINGLNQTSEMSDSKLRRMTQSVLNQHDLEPELISLLQKLDVTNRQTVRKAIQKLQQIQQTNQSKIQQLMDMEERVMRSRREVAFARAESIKNQGSKKQANSSGSRGTSGKKTLGHSEKSLVSDWETRHTDRESNLNAEPRTINRLVSNKPKLRQLEPTNELTLQSQTGELSNEVDSFADQYSSVYLGESESKTSVSFEQSYQQAQKQYASAIEKKQIPLRYRQQIKDYLTELAKQDN